APAGSEPPSAPAAHCAWLPGPPRLIMMESPGNGCPGRRARGGQDTMLRFNVVNKRATQSFEHPAGPIEFGRGPQRNGVPRCVIQDSYISRDHVHVEEIDAAHVRVTNLSQRNSIRLSDN